MSTKIMVVIIAVIMIIAALTIPSHAENDAVAIHDGDDVVQALSGELYVGQGVAFNGPWVTLFNVRFPEHSQGGTVGAITFPAEKVLLLYHKGAVGEVQNPAPNVDPHLEPK